MKDTKDRLYKSADETLARILSLLPPAISREILSVGASRRDFPSGLSEIRLRRSSPSSLTVSGECVFLSQIPRETDFLKTFDTATEGSLYAHSYEIAEGYITLEGGVRVGVCGDFNPETGGVKRVSSLIFRLPMSKSQFGDELLAEWERGGVKGMLIYSLPGCGKTSALRALAPALSQRLRLRVAVVDERHEFFDECGTGQVDILSGYGKAKGIEIARRTLSSEVIVVDEIGSADEALAIMRAGNGGVPVVASAHAADFEELCQREGISELISKGYFNCFARLTKNGGEYSCEIKRVGLPDTRERSELLRV